MRKENRDLRIQESCSAELATLVNIETQSGTRAERTEWAAHGIIDELNLPNLKGVVNINLTEDVFVVCFGWHSPTVHDRGQPQFIPSEYSRHLPMKNNTQDKKKLHGAHGDLRNQNASDLNTAT